MSELSYLEKLLDGVEVEWKTLEDISIKISSGGTPKTGVSEFYDGDIPWLRTQEVNFCDIWDTEVKITESGVKNSSAKWIHKELCHCCYVWGNCGENRHKQNSNDNKSSVRKYST
ncbi:hypothetical protein ACMFB3_23370 (plasmid) [Escherichia coli]